MYTQFMAGRYQHQHAANTLKQQTRLFNVYCARKVDVEECYIYIY